MSEEKDLEKTSNIVNCYDPYENIKRIILSNETFCGKCVENMLHIARQDADNFKPAQSTSDAAANDKKTDDALPDEAETEKIVKKPKIDEEPKEEVCASSSSPGRGRGRVCGSDVDTFQQSNNTIKMDTKKDENTIEKNEDPAKKDEDTAKKDEDTAKKDEDTAKKDENPIEMDNNATKKEKKPIDLEEIRKKNIQLDRTYYYTEDENNESFLSSLGKIVIKTMQAKAEHDSRQNLPVPHFDETQHDADSSSGPPNPGPGPDESMMGAGASGSTGAPHDGGPTAEQDGANQPKPENKRNVLVNGGHLRKRFKNGKYADPSYEDNEFIYDSENVVTTTEDDAENSDE